MWVLLETRGTTYRLQATLIVINDTLHVVSIHVAWRFIYAVDHKKNRKAFYDMENIFHFWSYITSNWTRSMGHNDHCVYNNACHFWVLHEQKQSFVRPTKRIDIPGVIRNCAWEWAAPRASVSYKTRLPFLPRVVGRCRQRSGDLVDLDTR